MANSDESGLVEAKPMQKIQWAVLGAILIAYTASSGILRTRLEKSPPFPQMRQDEGLIEHMKGVQRAHLRDILLHSSASGGAKKNLVATVTVRSGSLEQEAFANEVASTILQNDPNAQSYDQLTIQLYYGYDIGIAQRWNHQEFAHTPAEWRKRMLGASTAQAQQ